MARHLNRVLLVALLVALVDVTTSSYAEEGRVSEFDFGFFASRDRDLEGNSRLRILGPFFERRKTMNGTTFTAVRPIVSSLTEPDKGKSVHELLWPIGMYKRFKDQTSWRFLIAYGDDYDNTTAGSRWRFAIFPLVFAGKDAKGENYFAVFPIGGKINEFIGEDSVRFFLFPLYFSNTLNGVTSRSIMWPLLSRTKGGDLDRIRIAPFYGRSTNAGRWTKRFVMWPLYTSVKYHYPGTTGGGFLLFPLFGRTKIDVDNQISYWLFPPLFRFGRSDKGSVLHCPWPIIQRTTGPVDRFNVWPIWGRKTVGSVDTTFALWPFISTERQRRKAYSLNRFSLRPFVYYESRSPKLLPSDNTLDGDHKLEPGVPPAQRDGRYFKLWPLFSYRRRADMARFRCFDFWPAQNMTGIEKNWAPFWTLYTHVRLGDASEDELLWGLFRHRKDGRGGRRFSLFPLFKSEKSVDGDGARDWSVLLGLLGYEREGLRKTYRLLYFLKWRTGKEGE